jgi:NAD(P)-dependent dehydrogenase (short-subunit alcohol dehydrogenase family)
MARAMKAGGRSGRLAYRAGRMGKRRYADPSSPLAGLICVNSIAPGPIATNFAEGMQLSEEEMQAFANAILQRLALKRFGTAEEVAAVACFLLSDDASYVTGSQYFVDGGMTFR